MIIDRYIAREVVRPLVLGCALLTLIFSAYSSATFLSDAAGGRLQPGTIASLIGLHTIVALEILLPTALYFSVVAGVQRLYRDSEMAALQAAGIGELRIVWTVLRVSVVIALCVAVLSLYGRPWAYRASYTLEQQVVFGFDISNLQTGHFQRVGKGNHVLFAEDIDRDAGLLLRIFFQLDHGEKSKVIYAQEAYLPPRTPGGGQAIVFLDGYAYDLDRHGNRDVALRFGQLTIRVGGGETTARFKRKAVASTALARSRRPADIAELQWRLSTPLATVLLALLAVPLARSNRRRPRYAATGAAVIVYAAMFSLLAMARTWVEQGTIPPMPGIWWVYGLCTGLLAWLLAQPRWSLRRTRQ